MIKKSLLSLLVLGSPVLAHAEPMSYAVSREQPAEVRFVLDAPLDSIEGITHAVSGKAEFDTASGAGSGKFSVDLKSFKTGISLRDRDLRDQFFEAGTYPAATLTIKYLVQKNATMPDLNRSGHCDATAVFSLHGVDRTLTIPVRFIPSVQNGKNVLFVSGTFEVPLKDYNIKRPGALFLKVGEVAKVEVRALLIGPEAASAAEPVAAKSSPASGPAASATPDNGGKVEQASASAPLPPVSHSEVVTVGQVNKLKAEKRPPQFRFAANTPAGQGERLIRDPKIGGTGNALSCASCHNVTDERSGLMGLKVAFVPPNRTLWDSAKRPLLWQGLAKTPGKATEICVKRFMLKPEGLTPKQEAAFEAYLKAISPDDAVPALDYRALALTRKSDIAHPTSGNAKRGEGLEKRFCAGCHAVGQVRPPLTRGLYEPDYLVQRVRWLPGNDARQMPPIYVDRLTDSDLRDIVTYLSGKGTKRIFDRTKTAANTTSRPEEN